MSDEVDTQPDAQPTVTEPAPTPAEPQVKLLTQEQVDEIVKREKAKTERRVRNEMRAASPEPTKPEPKVERDPLVAELLAKQAFSEALEDLDWKPSKDDRETLRDMFLAKGADGMEKLAKRLKPAPTAETPKPEVKTDPAKKETPVLVTTGVAPVPTNPMDIPPGQVTAADVERMRADGSLLDWGNRQGRGGMPHPFGGKRARILRGMPK